MLPYRKYKLSALLSAVVMLSTACFTHEVMANVSQGFSVQDAVTAGLKTNPELAGVFQNQLATEQRVKQTQALYLPSIDLQAETGYEVTKTPSIADEEMNRRRMSLTLTQLLFDGFGTTHAIKRQKASAIAAGHRVMEVAELLGLNIISQYLNILRRRELLSSAAKNVAGHEDLSERIEEGVRKGKFNRGDLAQVISRLERARANEESVQQSLSEAESAYWNAVGQAPRHDFVRPVFNASLLTGSLNDLIEEAKKSSPTLATVQASFNAADAGHEESKSALYPQMNFVMSSTQGEDLSGIEGTDKGQAALFVMRWNLFRGGADRAREKETLHQRAAAHYDAVNAMRVLEQSMRDTWTARDTAVRQVGAFERQLKANKTVVRAYKDQFQVNRRSLIDLLDARNASYASEGNRINADYSALFANYRLLALGGRLLDSLKVIQSSYEGAPATEKGNPEPLQEPVLNKETWNINSALSRLAALGVKIDPLDLGAEGDDVVVTKGPARYLQLGVYDTPAEAKDRWEVFVQQHRELMGDLTERIQFVDVYNNKEYRLQIGPTTVTAGEELCGELKSRGVGGCFIVAN